MRPGSLLYHSLGDKFNNNQNVTLMNMMRYSKAILFLSSILLLSCSKEIDSVQSPVIDDIAEQKFGPEMVLGEKLNNPYSLSNMQAAYESLVRTKSGEGTEVEELEANWLYVRVLPKDSTDVSFLIDSGLELFDYPLDYEIEVYGNSYHDPSIPEDEITWQYTRVRPDFHFPETMQYEILDECYIPEDDIETKSGTLFNQGELEITAIENAGYKIDEAPLTKGSAAQHCPSGFVKMEQTAGNFVPAKGVKVKCNYFLKINSDYTTEYGFYYINTFFYVKPHYHIIFENEKDFKIWEGAVSLSVASKNYGRFDMKGHDFKICLSDDEWNLAAINNASYEYYKHCKDTGIKTPPSNLRICAIHADWSSAPMLKHLAGYKLTSGALATTFFLSSCPVLGWIAAAATVIMSGILPDVYIGDYYTDYDDLKSMVFHELGHASHYSVVGEKVWGSYIEHIVTSWASGKGTYGDGKKNDAKQKICELGECWGYTSESLERKWLDTNNEWFAPAITSLYNVISYSYISKTNAFSCLKTDTKSIDSFFNNLIAKAPAKAKYIEDEFARNKSLTNQTLFAIKNDTGSLMYIKYIKEGKIYSKNLSVGCTYILGGRSGAQSNTSSTIESVFDLYEEFSISTYASGSYEERFLIKGGTQLKDFSNSLYSDVLCVSSNENNPIGNKNTRTYTYEIKASDL